MSTVSQRSVVSILEHLKKTDSQFWCTIDNCRLNAHSEDIQQRMRVEHMERQLANLTGLVQKALQAPGTAQSPRDFLPVGPHFRTPSQG